MNAHSMNATVSAVLALIHKLDDADSDHRFMALNDLHTTLSTGTQSLLAQDYGVSSELADGILKRLDDQNGEVQNLAIKW